MDRRKNKDVVFHAFQCAIQDRVSYAKCWPEGSEERAEALADVKAFRRMSTQLVGTDRSLLDEAKDKSESISIFELRSRMKADEDGRAE